MSRLVPDWLVEAAARLPAGPALRAPSARWSWSQLLEAADGLALALAGVGLEPGQTLACLLADDAAVVALVHAARRLGLVLLPLNRRAAAAELRYQLETSGAAVLVHDEADAVLAKDCAVAAVRRHRIEVLLAAAPCGLPPALRDEVDLEAPATIVFTSGTTGRPKGAVLSHGTHVASADAWAAVLEPRPTDRWLACLPLYHVAGLAMVMRTARWAVELQVLERFEAAAVSDALDTGVTHLSLVAVQLGELLEGRGASETPASLRAILLGGGAIPTEVLSRARDSGYPVLTTYGMTETGSGVVVGGADAATLADPSAGRALTGVEIAIAPDGSDEILLRGPMLFSGYLGDPTATADKLRDGWLHTGDSGRLDDRGLLRVSGRRDDLIISGGENIYPAEVEAVIREHPGVVDAVVLARSDPRWGAVPVAAIVLRPGAVVTDADLERHCRERLAGYKVPVSFERVAALPRDDLGKVRRHELALTLAGQAP